MGARHDNIGAVWHKASKRQSTIEAVQHPVSKRYNNITGVWRQGYTSGIPITHSDLSGYQSWGSNGRGYTPIHLSDNDNFRVNAAMQGYGKYSFTITASYTIPYAQFPVGTNLLLASGYVTLEGANTYLTYISVALQQVNNLTNVFNSTNGLPPGQYHFDGSLSNVSLSTSYLLILTIAGKVDANYGYNDPILITIPWSAFKMIPTGEPLTYQP